jgi:hypothetical protein
MGGNRARHFGPRATLPLPLIATLPPLPNARYSWAMDIALGLAVLSVPLLVGTVLPSRYRLIAALIAAVVAASAWTSGLSIHGNFATLFFYLAAPFSLGALSRAGTDCLPVKLRRLSPFLGVAILMWAIWFSPALANDEPPFGATFMLFSLVQMAGLGILASAVVAKLFSPPELPDVPQ